MHEIAPEAQGLFLGALPLTPWSLSLSGYVQGRALKSYKKPVFLIFRRLAGIQEKYTDILITYACPHKIAKRH
jgi:hypothetical protein